jgi:hypothetical protein
MQNARFTTTIDSFAFAKWTSSEGATEALNPELLLASVRFPKTTDVSTVPDGVETDPDAVVPFHSSVSESGTPTGNPPGTGTFCQAYGTSLLAMAIPRAAVSDGPG